MFDEPEVQPDDTRPTLTVPVVNVNDDAGHDADDDAPGARRGLWLAGVFSLLAAVGLLATAVILLTGETPPEDPVPQGIGIVETLPTQTPNPDPTAPPDEPTTDPQNAPPVTSELISAPGALPTLSTDALASLLATPVTLPDTADSPQIRQSGVSPFTIIPDRPRNTVIDYTIVRGDTVYDIAQRFNISQDSIAWSNDRRSLWTLTPGSTLRIPPQDGVIHIAVGTATIADIARQYRVDDPTVITDSPANQLFGVDPATIPPSGMMIFVPGGVAEEINWAPPIVEGGGGGSGGGGEPGTVSFEPGAPGSCAPMPPGQGTTWVRPINSYTITRGFTDWHPGIDLAAAEGTPVFAANGGRVIFAGWSNWGYGLAVVISHGPFFTLYAHLSQVNVSCGQVVNAGQTIGAVGSTGQSSGPHLHFEILYGNTRTNPTATIPF